MFTYFGAAAASNAAIPENDAHIPKTYELTFSERIGGRLQIGGYAERKFTFTPEWTDFLFRITHKKEQDNALRTFLNP